MASSVRHFRFTGARDAEPSQIDVNILMRLAELREQVLIQIIALLSADYTESAEKEMPQQNIRGEKIKSPGILQPNPTIKQNINVHQAMGLCKYILPLLDELLASSNTLFSVGSERSFVERVELNLYKLQIHFCHILKNPVITGIVTNFYYLITNKPKLPGLKKPEGVEELKGTPYYLREDPIFSELFDDRSRRFILRLGAVIDSVTSPLEIKEGSLFANIYRFHMEALAASGELSESEAKEIEAKRAKATEADAKEIIEREKEAIVTARAKELILRDKNIILSFRAKEVLDHAIRALKAKPIEEKKDAPPVELVRALRAMGAYIATLTDVKKVGQTRLFVEIADKLFTAPTRVLDIKLLNDGIGSYFHETSGSYIKRMTLLLWRQINSHLKKLAPPREVLPSSAPAKKVDSVASPVPLVPGVPAAHTTDMAPPPSVSVSLALAPPPSSGDSVTPVTPIAPSSSGEAPPPPPTSLALVPGSLAALGITANLNSSAGGGTPPAMRRTY